MCVKLTLVELKILARCHITSLILSWEGKLGNTVLTPRAILMIYNSTIIHSRLRTLMWSVSQNDLISVSCLPTLDNEHSFHSLLIDVLTSSSLLSLNISLRAVAVYLRHS